MENTYEFGFIGAGNMGSALADAIRKVLAGEKIIVSDACTDKATALSEKLGCAFGTNYDVVKNSRFVFLGVKPQMLSSVLNDLREAISERSTPCIFISMAAGVRLDRIAEMAGEHTKIIRIMPNTPVAVGKGVILYCRNEYVSESELGDFVKAMSCAGMLDQIDESDFDSACALSGCGPAFVYMFAKSMAEGGVCCGLSYEYALKYATQTIIGAAELLKASQRSPDELKTAVCSPNGSTIEGVKILESSNFDNEIKSAIKASYKRTCELGK